MVNDMAAFAEYERELIHERVQAGVYEARTRSLRFGPAAPDAAKVARNLRTVKHLIEEGGLGVVQAANTVGWSKAAYYRHRSTTSRR